MTLETMRELFGITHVSDTKRMHVGEEVVPLSQGLDVAVPLEEEEVLVPQPPPPSHGLARRSGGHAHPGSHCCGR
jgi:hypothetical protein